LFHGDTISTQVWAFQLRTIYNPSRNVQIHAHNDYTVTFSYTTPFWTWKDWELELDWAALRGVNLILAWTGYEKVLLDSLRDIGLADSEILPFFTGPAFQAWNRMGNIQGSWGNGPLTVPWFEAQFDLQKKIVKRIVDLGMTPVLPAFSGFVPSALQRVRPQASIMNGAQWSGFATNLTEVSFLSPLDKTFGDLQKSIVHKQMRAFGNITHVYALDQFNEINPSSGNSGYLRNLSYATWQSLKKANPASVWLMQGWLFYNNRDFWNLTRISAYLDGVENNTDMLILDLYSESQPQWQRTKSYFGKPWIWCQLHDFGGNMGLYGQIMNLTHNPIQALNQSDSLVGFGLTMEGQEGNEILYDLLLDQAWSGTPIDTRVYFRYWVTSRYAGNNSIPGELYTAWDTMRKTLYNNTNLTTNAVIKSIFELSPDVEGLLGRTGHYPTATTITYDPGVLRRVWGLFLNATKGEPGLWKNRAFRFDLVDVTRQVMGNAFVRVYSDLIASWKKENWTKAETEREGQDLLEFLRTIDKVLSCDEKFSLSTWISSARKWGNSTASKNVFEYNARNQVTLWGPTGEISDYASKAWAGLISSYYVPRWSIFLDYLNRTNGRTYNRTEVQGTIQDFELSWQVRNSEPGVSWANGSCGSFEAVMGNVSRSWPSVFNNE
jgi:alpha-N-acetylglucosaminidase